jgi:hypothetical protein
MPDMPERSSLASRPQATDFVLAHPLDEFYAMAGLALPPLVPVEGEVVPEPYKRLLVHQDDMTPTLEKFYRRRLHLHVLGRRRKDDAYYREVTLLLDGTDQPVEFGAIRINLALFDPVAREEILKEKLPLGAILRERTISHSSRPRAFIRLASDPFINDVLKLSGAQMLFGRRNSLLDPKGRPLAEIVEILPTA